jgi:hypothetical protein
MHPTSAEGDRNRRPSGGCSNGGFNEAGVSGTLSQRIALSMNGSAAEAIASTIVVFPLPFGPSKSTSSPCPAGSGKAKTASSKGPMSLKESRAIRMPPV